MIVRVGLLGEIPPQNRPMLVFNGLPYRRSEMYSHYPNLPTLGEIHVINPMDYEEVAGKFGRWYNDRIEWMHGRHLSAMWTLRPSGRPMITVTGEQFDTTVEKLMPRRRWIYA
jgi:hypothetical protein